MSSPRRAGVRTAKQAIHQLVLVNETLGASESRPLAAVELAEVLATSDVPVGVVNVLTGLRTELAPVLAGHMDVNAIDLTGVGEDGAALERLAAENVKRVVRGPADGQSLDDSRPCSS